METVVRRKPTNFSSDERNGRNISTNFQMDEIQNKMMMSAEPEFSYGSILLQGLCAPVIVSFAFGGRPAIISLCFGTLVAYIFDLLGTLEATMVTILVTLMAIWGTQVFAARILLQESILNISMIAILAIILIFVFIVIAGHFRALRNEMDGIFFFLEPILFANIPLLCSSVLTWFLCVEIPSLDLPVCFSTCYFIYMIIFAKPRLSSSTNEHTPLKDYEPPKYIISRPVLQTLYILPVIIAPLLHLSLHHNVLETSWSRITGILMAVLYPSILMVLAAENQIHYWAPSDRTTVSHLLSITKLVLCLALVLSLQSHPLLDDLKVFSGLTEPLSSYSISGAIFLVFAAIYTHREKSKESAHLPRAGTIHERSQLSIMYNPVVTICISFASLLGSLLLGLHWTSIPLCVFGAACLAELYQRNWADTEATMQTYVVALLLLIVAAISTGQTGYDMAEKTLWHLSFNFKWHVDLDMPQFCIICIGLSMLAVALPCVAVLSSGGDPADIQDRSHSSLFGMLFLGFAVVMSTGEVLVREQDWLDVGTTVEAVYPAYLMGGTALITLITAIHLLSMEFIQLDTVVAVVIVQGCKLLPLMGLSSLAAGSLSGLTMSFILPFLLSKADSNMDDTTTAAAGTGGDVMASAASEDNSSQWRPALLLLAYLLSAAASTWWSSTHVFPLIMSAILQNEPSTMQCIAAAAACYFCFSAALIHRFSRKATAIRSMLLVISSLCALVAAEALGPLSVSVDSSSATYLVVSMHPELASDQTGLFLMLTALLIFLAVANVFPIRKPVSRLLFLFLFSFCSAKATMGWAFPHHIGGSGVGIHSKQPSMGYLSLPWIYCFVTALLSTSAALHASVPNASATGNWLLALCGCLPIFAIIWSWLQGSLTNFLSGILWTVAVGNSGIAIATRLNDLFKELSPHNATRQKATEKSSHSRSICALAAILGLSWAMVATSVTPHAFSDVIVPVFSLLLLCTKRGLLVPDTHPWALVAMVCTFWWLLSAMMAIFLNQNGSGGFKLGVFHDSDVSLWTSSSQLMPWVTLALAVLPLPAILLAYMRWKGETEDLMFLLTILSAISIVGGNIWSVKLLGVLGVIYGGWRCKDIGSRKTASDRII